MKHAISFCLLFLFFGSLSKVYAQQFKSFKTALQTDGKRYKETVPCEQEAQKAVLNLDGLIWADSPPSEVKKKIVESCKFVKAKPCASASVKQIATEIANFYKNEAAPSSSEEVSAAIENTPVSNFVDTLVLPEDVPVKEVSQNVSTFSSFSENIFLWILTSLLTLLCGWLCYKVLQLNKTSLHMKDQYLQKIDNPDLTQFLKEMRDALGRTESRISELEGEVRDLQSKLNSSPQNTSFHHLSPADSTPITQTDTHTPIPLEPPVLPSQGEMRYALYMDNSEGFSISGLMYEKGPETVYEIALISPHTATYRIANQRDAQSYALTDPGYYLRTACDYENSPTSGRAIETVASGSLELMGSIWKITQRAKIKFV